MPAAFGHSRMLAVMPAKAGIHGGPRVAT